MIGYSIDGEHREFGPLTEASLRSFQRARGLVVDGICGPHAWNSLVEADMRLGDRLLYYRSPMMRGDDVEDLQQRLGSLGFDARWVDGIFGVNTHDAVREFQQKRRTPRRRSSRPFHRRSTHPALGPLRRRNHRRPGA